MRTDGDCFPKKNNKKKKGKNTESSTQATISLGAGKH